MGKIVKYCANCEESFAEKFSFCPNCAAALTAYEMNPLAGATSIEPIKADEPVISAPISEPTIAEETQEFKAQTEEPTATYEDIYDDILETEETPVKKPEEIFEEPKAVSAKSNLVTIAPAAIAPNTVEDYSQTYPANGNGQPADSKNSFSEDAPAANLKNENSRAENLKEDYKTNITPPVMPTNKTYNSDGGYNITFVEEKNNGVRRGLLLGAFMLVTIGTLSGLVISLYNSDALVGSLEEQMMLVAPVADDMAPEPIEPEPPPKKNKDDGGGGGGGGNKDQNETSKGRLATQDPKPQIPPSVTMAQVTNPALVLKPATQGNRIEKPSTEPYGNPNSLSTIPSDGTGSGGGQGSGIGRGQGSGRGTGAGSGIGSGNGSGNGNGNGDGIGDGDGPPAIRKPEPVGPTEAIKITSKPRANYTDAARQNQVQGTVTLRVTFLANGSIGSISTVSGLPNGLTEQAIAAARGMRFDPAKKGGVPYTVTKQVQYNFTLY